MEQDIFFVGVDKPDLLRRNLMEASKLTINFFHQANEFQSLRQRKIRLLEQLSEVVVKTNALIGELKHSFPNIDSLPLPQLDIVAHNANLQALENELTDIENQLDQLN
ncbi:hypothetical protein GOV04_05590 [Candidatus Woesearchaeota archaeon]|nr:hypothetical protein [Candidatus Woesearchaeota archaeon]